MRVSLRPPDAEPFILDVVDGKWSEPIGDAGCDLGDGLWALPGLVDAHAHLATAELNYLPGDPSGAVARAGEALRAGVTLILDKGWCDATTVEMMHLVPPEQRPEIEAAARVIAGIDGYWPGFAREVGADELDEAVDEEARRGAGWVKLIGDWPRKGSGPVANFTEAELARAVKRAGESGCSVAIHTMAREVPSQAVAAGVQSIEHGLFLTEGDLELLGERGGMWVPTILRVEALVTQLGEGSSGGKLMLEGLANVSKLLPVAVEAGVTVLAGTDLVGSSANVAAETLKLAQYGLTAVQAISAVSTGVFAALGREDPFRPGQPADVVFYSANPLADLAVLAHPSHVVRLGRPI